RYRQRHFALVQLQVFPECRVERKKYLFTGDGLHRGNYEFFFFPFFSSDLRHFVCASTTAINTTFTICRTVEPSCRMCTGFFMPSRMGPMESKPATSCRRL